MKRFFIVMVYINSYSTFWKEKELLYFVLALALMGQSVDSTDVSILAAFRGFSSHDGFLRVAVFDSPEFWPEDKDNALLALTFPVDGDVVTIDLSELSPGYYAIAAFHDKDGDAVFDRGLFGVPKERYGFSNGARSSTGPPDYEDALFLVTDEPLELEIVLE